MQRWLVALITIVAVLAGIDRWSPSVALAHAGLESSTPAASSVLETSPPLIVLDFDEAIDVPLTSIELFDASSQQITLGAPSDGANDADGSVVQSMVPALDDGTYAVVWRISSADGHVVTGAFSFQVGTGGSADDFRPGSELIDDVAGGVGADPVVGRLLGIARFTAFAGVAVLFGGLLMVLAVARSAGAAELVVSTRRLLWIGWALLTIATAANFGLLGANAVGGGFGDAFDSALWGDIADTRSGGLLLIRLALLVVSVGVLIELRARGRVWWRALVLATGLLTVCTFSGGGHPSVQSKPLIWMGIDAIHLALITGWLGGLAMMVVGGRVWLSDDPHDPSHANAVRWFSRVATIGVPLIVVTGVLQAWRLSGGWATLTDSTWGRVLLAKGTLVVLVVTIGAGSRWLLSNDGPSGLRKTVVTETVIGLVVLGLAAGMVGVPPQAAAKSAVFETSLAEGGVIVQVSVTPGHVGANQVHAVVIPAGGSLVPIANLIARVSLPANGIPDIPVAMVAESPNHYSGAVTLAFSGDWTLELVVSPQPTESILLTTTVAIP